MEKVSSNGLLLSAVILRIEDWKCVCRQVFSDAIDTLQLGTGANTPINSQNLMT